jgi:hypothetical protein
MGEVLTISSILSLNSDGDDIKTDTMIFGIYSCTTS